MCPFQNLNSVTVEETVKTSEQCHGRLSWLRVKLQVMLPVLSQSTVEKEEPNWRLGCPCGGRCAPVSWMRYRS